MPDLHQRIHLADDTPGNAPLGTVANPLKTSLVGVAGVQRTPSASKVTNAGAIAAGAMSVAFVVTGAASATVAGVVWSPGQGASWSEDSNDTLGAIAYDATGSEITFTQVR